MPIKMPQMERFNYYGFSGFIVALLSIAAYFVLKNKQCLVSEGYYDNLAIIQITGTVCGSVIFLLSLFNTATTLYDTKQLLFAAVIAIIIVSGLLLWTAYIACTQLCVGYVQSKLYIVLSTEEANNIAIAVLDIIAGLTLFSIGFTFVRRL